MSQSQVPKDVLLDTGGGPHHIVRILKLWNHSLVSSGGETISVFQSKRSDWTDNDRRNPLPGVSVTPGELHWEKKSNDFGSWWEALWLRRKDNRLFIFRVLDE